MNVPIECTKEDIILIAFIDYGWSVGDNTDVIFDVVDTQGFLENLNDEKLKKIEESKKRKLVYIVNVGNSHWVTLVIVYRHEQFFSYFIDPRGNDVDANIKNHLDQKKIHCPKFENNERTALNNGILALKYASTISKELNSRNEVFSQKIMKLSRTEDMSYKNLSRAEFEEKVKKLSEKREKGKRSALEDKIYAVDFCAAEIEDGFENRMSHLCLKLKEFKMNEATFIISSKQTKKSPFATVTLAFRDEQVVAWYVASERTHTKDIERILSENCIVTIYAKDDIENPIQGIAKIATQCVETTDDYTTFAKNALRPINNDKEIQKFTSKLNAIKKVRGKIQKCMNWIKKYVKHYGKKLKKGREINYTHAQINYIILFLESAALQDTEISASVKTVLRRRMIQDEDYKLINKLRSEHLLHRDDSINKTIIASEDIKKYIRHDVDRVTLLKKMTAYLTQMIKKLNGMNIVQEERVDDFFIKSSELDNLKGTLQANQKLEEQVKDYVCKTFRRLISDDSSKRNQCAMFELNVNIVPLLEGLYGKPPVRKLENGELERLRKEVKHYLHRFLEYENEPARQYFLKVFMFNFKPTIFKFNLSCEVYNFLQDSPNSGSIRQKIDHLFELEKETLCKRVSFLNRSYHTVMQIVSGLRRRLTLNRNSQHEIESSLEESSKTIKDIGSFISNYVNTRKPLIEDQHEVPYPYTNSIARYNLKRFIQDYVKIMVAIDNKEQIAHRKNHELSNPKRYGKYILNENRLTIYKGFRVLKTLYDDDRNGSYVTYEKELKKELKKCGILKSVFSQIVDLYVTESHKINSEFSDKICGMIIENVESFDDEILEVFRMCNDALEHSYNVSAGKFADNVRELNRNVITNVQEVFEDETFLTFLTHYNTNFSTQVIEELRQINYFSNYLQTLEDDANP